LAGEEYLKIAKADFPARPLAEKLLMAEVTLTVSKTQVITAHNPVRVGTI
jgi:hypothetical protein